MIRVEEINEYAVGNTVHYVSYGTPGGEYTRQCRAAIVTARDKTVDETRVSLAVLNPTGLFFDVNCPRSEGSQTGGTWHVVWNCGGV